MFFYEKRRQSKAEETNSSSCKWRQQQLHVRRKYRSFFLACLWMGKKGSKFYYSASPQQIIQQFYSLNSFCSFSTTSVVAALFLELQTWTLRDFMTYMLAIQFQLSSSLLAAFSLIKAKDIFGYFMKMASKKSMWPSRKRTHLKMHMS